MNMLRRLMTVTVKSVDEKQGIIVFMGTTPTKDRYGDVVVPQGGDLSAYRKNPVFLWAHDYRMPPIGKSVREVITSQGIEFHIQFDLKDDFAVSIFRKYKEGFLSATSIGFQPTEAEPLEGGGYKFTKWGLMELSGVPVPANPEALALALKGLAAGGDGPTQAFAEDILRWAESSSTQVPELADGDHVDLEPDGEIPKEFVVDVDPDTDEPILYDQNGKALGAVMITDPAMRFFRPDEQKAGAVLNKANKGRLNQIKMLADEVLASAEAAADEADDGEKATKPPEMLPNDPQNPTLTPSTASKAPVLSSLPASATPPNPPALAGPLSLNPHDVAKAVAIAVQREVARLMGKAPLD